MHLKVTTLISVNRKIKVNILIYIYNFIITEINVVTNKIYLRVTRFISVIMRILVNIIIYTYNFRFTEINVETLRYILYARYIKKKKKIKHLSL